MATVKTDIGARDDAYETRFAPTAAIVATDVQRAIEAVASASAPVGAEYLLGASTATLTNGRVVTDTATISWDLATANQAKANIVADSVSNTLLANMAQATIKGRAAGAGTGDPTDLTAAQVQTVLGFPTSSTDNTVVRFDGTAGGIQGTGIVVDDSNVMTGVAQLGVGGATPDATNVLSINAPAILFNRETANIQVKLNKQTATDTASFLFQTGFSGRAEIGLVGSDDFVFKTSPDGVGFNTGISIAAATGIPTLTTPTLNGTVTGTGVSQSSSASTLVQRDANQNIFSNNYFANAASVASAGGTTVLTAASARAQRLTGAASQTFQLPNATTLSLGPVFTFDNNSSGSLIIANAGSVTQYTVPPGGYVTAIVTDISTSNGVWDFHPSAPATVTWGSGTTGLVMNSALSTTATIAAGAASSTVPVFIPQRGSATTGIGGDSTHVYGIVSGATALNIAATATSPGASDGATLGTTALQWSDLFLASGGVINFNNGNYTITHSAGDLAFSGIVTLPNTGLHLLDTNASHDLILAPGSDLTADRTLTLTTGDASRTLTLSTNVTLDQDLSTTSSPTFVNETLTGYIDLSEISTPANPAANVGRVYAKDNGGVTTLYFLDNAGTETDLLAGSGGTSNDFQRFDASGTWTKPGGFAATSRVLVRAWGGGGSGGTSNNNSPSGGGGGGGYSERWLLLSDLGATETVTIGAGGASVSTSNTLGNAGGNTTFGSLLTAYGGGRGGSTTTRGGGAGGGLFSAASGSTQGEPTILTATTPLALGQGGNAVTPVAAQHGVWHGGGGSDSNNTAGSSLYGGGGGAGHSGTATGTAGTSVNGGDGGAAGINGATGTAGAQPGGGGGGAEGAVASGAGGSGRVDVYVFGA